MKERLIRILAVFCLLALGMGLITASAEVSLSLATPRMAVAVDEWVRLSDLVLTGKATRWESSDPKVLRVDADGSATGVAVGEAILTAYGTGEQTATCTVTVGYYTGIDVSYAQTVDWNLLSQQGMSFAILRSSYGWYDPVADAEEDFEFQLDAKLRENVAGAKQVGIPFGLYHYSYADSVADAEAEADYLLALLERVGITPADLKLPIAYDVEHDTPNFPCLTNLRKMGKAEASKVVLAFCQKLQNAGYRTALYTSKSHMNDLFDLNTLTQNGVRLWMAWFGTDEGEYIHEEVAYTLPGGPPVLQGQTPYMWQFTETGKVTGVTRLATDPKDVDTVDINVMYMSQMMLHRPGEKPTDPPQPPIVTPLLGDTDGNGSIASADALMTLQAATGRIKLTDAQIQVADVDKDSAVTAGDALLILQYATKKITKF